ncbi:hypothetical protein [Chryseobacterium nepalense]|uniref:hypothetical protein n=1 Tax=Chryseobacterium nepalense TaxID=1854498 RepID=UPI002DF8D00F|nr:hypothetical protein [Chryseobacterium nepalense]
MESNQLSSRKVFSHKEQIKISDSQPQKKDLFKGNCRPLKAILVAETILETIWNNVIQFFARRKKQDFIKIERSEIVLISSSTVFQFITINAELLPFIVEFSNTVKL